MNSGRKFSLRARLQILLPFILHLVFLSLVLIFLSFKGVFGSTVRIVIQFIGSTIWAGVWGWRAERQYWEQKPIGKIRQILLGW